MELLQFSYFSRKQQGVIGVDVVDEMLTASAENFVEAEKLIHGSRRISWTSEKEMR